MPAVKAKDVHIWSRDPHDWYVEPYECSAAILDSLAYDPQDLLWDPACGSGRIVESAEAIGLRAVGSDLVYRSKFCSEKIDFFRSDNCFDARHIISNPPFGRAEDFVLHSLDLISDGGTVCMLLPLVWASGFSTKRSWLPKSPLMSMHVLSPRPSMPPGKVIEAGVRPGNGTKDFAWFVWEKGYKGDPKLHFLNTSLYRSKIERRGRASEWSRQRAVG